MTPTRADVLALLDECERIAHTGMGDAEAAFTKLRTALTSEAVVTTQGPVETIEERLASMERLLQQHEVASTGDLWKQHSYAWRKLAIDAVALCRSLQQQLAARDERIRVLTNLLDYELGTPCEQIRHQQEVEELREQLAAKSAEAARMGNIARQRSEQIDRLQETIQAYQAGSTEALTTAEGGKS